jgi:hypothetical protein
MGTTLVTLLRSAVLANVGHPRADLLRDRSAKGGREYRQTFDLRAVDFRFARGHAFDLRGLACSFCDLLEVAVTDVVALRASIFWLFVGAESATRTTNRTKFTVVRSPRLYG